ncbi:MAG: glutathionylspermidine synthase family protein, partial [Rhodospirillales bacterium]
MGSQSSPQHAPFGTLLGTGPGGVSVFSSDYPTASKDDLPDRDSYRSEIDGHFMGYKWQCVELARRYLYLNHGYVFDDIAMAYDIFRLEDVRRLDTDARLPLRSFRNGAKRPPEPGSLIIWNEGGPFQITGHVAVVTEVAADRVRIIEQNVEDKIWPDGEAWSRELPFRRDEEGACHLSCTLPDAEILGWVIQTDCEDHAESHDRPPPDLFNLRDHRASVPAAAGWLDPETRAEDRAYVAMMGGHRLAFRDTDQDRYFRLSETAVTELKRATNELHAMFLHATSFVLRHEEFQPAFNLPTALWSRLHQSWDNRQNQTITGRFDFSVSERGIKVYEVPTPASSGDVPIDVSPRFAFSKTHMVLSTSE